MRTVFALFQLLRDWAIDNKSIDKQVHQVLALILDGF